MGRQAASIRLPHLAVAGATLALFALPWFSPLVGGALCVATPAPVAWLYRQHGPAAGRRGLMLAAAGIVGLMAAGMWVAALLLLHYLCIAWGLGEAPARGWGEAKAVLVAAALSVAVTLGPLLVLSLAGAGADWGALDAAWRAQLAEVIDAYKAGGLDDAQAAQLREELLAAWRIAKHLAVGMLIAASLLLSWGNLLVARRLASGAQPGASPELLAWRAPEWLVWVLIACGGAMALLDGWWFWLGANGLLVCGMAYFFQGLAVVAYWLERKKAPLLLRVLLYTLIAVMMYLALLLAMVGLFDIWFNFRRLPTNQSS